jgi:Nickel responsive protein SCO4226-like
VAFVVVECDLAEPTSLPALRRLEADRRDCLGMRGVRRLRSFLSRDGRRLVLHYEAPDTEAVREVVRVLGLPATRIWTGIPAL